jgi:hypothetical protein
MSPQKLEAVEPKDVLGLDRGGADTVGSADVIVGVLAAAGQDELRPVLQALQEALAKLTVPTRALLVHGGVAADPVPSSDAAPTNGDAASVPLVQMLFEPALSTGSLSDPVNQFSTASRVLFGLTSKLGARACAIVASDPHTANAGGIYQLVRPILELGFDLVTPCYARPKFDGLLNRSILAPLTRALYGRRIQNPVGPDLGFSARFATSLQPGQAKSRGAASENQLPMVASAAIRGNYEICQAYLGARVRSAAEAPDLSSLLAQVLGPVFLDLEANAAYWQRSRGSESPAQFGAAEVWSGENTAVDPQRMIESFQLGWRNLVEVWGIALPPATLFELGKLSRLPREQFRVPDHLWVRVVYDFALAHRGSQISRDHLLRSMTPLYLAWLASFALEMETKDAAEVDRRLESLAIAYEAGKPYLLSRWRWPDRFNP